MASTKKKKGFFRKLVGVILRLIFLLIILVALLLGALTLTEYRPAPSEPLTVTGRSSEELDPAKPLTIMSWNLGYGALGDNADFFMDGGNGVRTATDARVRENLATMMDVIEGIDPDILFLQEIDRNATRTYGIDETELFGLRFSEMRAIYANNFKVAFVPYPIPPIGKVDSGIMTMSKYNYVEGSAERISLPCPFAWPIRTANLKRCLGVSRIAVPGSDKELVLINLHLEAYDSGEGKIAQTKALRNFLDAELEKGNYIIAGGDFNQTFSTVDPSLYPAQEGLWTAGSIDVEEYDEALSFLMDPETPTCRSLDRPYVGANQDSFQYYMIDGYIVSNNIQVERCVTLDEGFTSSDHNPVLLEVTLQ